MCYRHRSTSSASTSTVSFTKALVFFTVARQQKRIRLPRRALFDSSNHIRAAQPVRLGKVGRGPLRGMIRMRMVEADNIQTALAAYR